MSITPLDLVFMLLRKAPVRRILRAHRMLRDAGIRFSIARLETQALAGGDPELCAAAMVEAERTGLACTWEDVSAIDLCGADPLQAVRARADLDRVVGGAEYVGRFRKAPRL